MFENYAKKKLILGYTHHLNFLGIVAQYLFIFHPLQDCFNKYFIESHNINFPTFPVLHLLSAVSGTSSF